MRKVAYILPIVLFFLFLAFSCVAIALLTPLSIRKINAPLSIVRIGNHEPYLYLTGNQLTCAEDDVQPTIRCQYHLNEEKLELLVKYENDTKTHLTDCQSDYSGNKVNCTAMFILRHRSPYVVIHDDLGLSTNQIELLRKQNPQSYLEEVEWQKWVTVFSLIFTGIILIILWQLMHKLLPKRESDKPLKSHYLKNIYSFIGYFMACYLVFKISQFAFTSVLLLLGFID